MNKLKKGMLHLLLHLRLSKSLYAKLNHILLYVAASIIDHK